MTIKGWRNNPLWVAHYEAKHKAYWDRYLRRSHLNLMKEVNKIREVDIVEKIRESQLKEGMKK